MPSTYKYTGPKPRGFVNAMKLASDKGFGKHRTKFFPKHFLPSAPQRYPGDYAKVGAAPKVNNTELWKQRYARMSPAEKKRFHDEINKQRRGARNNRAQQKKPLVSSGALLAAATHGGLKTTGPAKRRRMQITAPHYFNFHKRGQIHKKSAMEAVSAAEEQEYARVVDKELQKFFNGRG